MEQLQEFLDDKLKYDKKYLSDLDAIYEIERFDGIYTSNVVRDSVITQIKELNQEREYKVTADMMKLTPEEKEKQLTYLYTNKMNIYAMIRSANDGIIEIDKVLKDQYLLKTRIKNAFKSIDYEKLEKQRRGLTNDLNSYGTVLSKLNELMQYFNGSNLVDVIV